MISRRSSSGSTTPSSTRSDPSRSRSTSASYSARRAATYAARSSSFSMAAILPAYTALPAASGPMTAIRAVGSARQASGAKPGPAIAYSPAPYAFRTTTLTCGTVASDTAVTIFAPCRMIPARSTSVPIMKPGTSARYTSGTLNASHNQMNLAALSALSPNSTPPRTAELFAMMPTVSPSMRPKPVTSSAAKSGLTSKNDASSTRPSMTSWMSNGVLSTSGTTPASSVRDGGSASYDGGESRQLDGRYEKSNRACSMASASSVASRSPQPLTVQCMRAPPISSSETRSPTTISAIRGLPRYMEALPSTMMTQSVKDGM